MIKLVDFSKYKKKQASELQTPIGANISEKAIPELEKSFISENIESEIKSEIPSFLDTINDITPNIDFTALANSSDFKRLIYLAITNKTWRGTNSGLELSLKKLKNRLKK
ncbi:hypothetical protein ES705_23611 [subsurface metagenome]